MTRMPLRFPAIGAGVGVLSADWWDEINESSGWQDGIFFSLCAAYALVSSVALVSLRFCINSIAFASLPISCLLSLCLRLNFEFKLWFCFAHTCVYRNTEASGTEYIISSVNLALRCNFWCHGAFVYMCVGSFRFQFNLRFFLPNIGARNWIFLGLMLRFEITALSLVYFTNLW